MREPEHYDVWVQLLGGHLRGKHSESYEMMHGGKKTLCITHKLQAFFKKRVEGFFHTKHDGKIIVWITEGKDVE